MPRIAAAGCGERTHVAPEHAFGVHVGGEGELAADFGYAVGPRGALTEPRHGRMSEGGSHASAALLERLELPRGSGRSRCTGTGCPRPPRGPPARWGRGCARAGRARSRRSPGCKSRTARRLRRRTRPGCPRDRSLRRERPSTVTMSAPTAPAASTMQEHTSLPSMRTEHDPHSPCSQAFFDPGQAEALAQHVEEAFAEPCLGDVALAPVDAELVVDQLAHGVRSDLSPLWFANARARARSAQTPTAWRR